MRDADVLHTFRPSKVAPLGVAWYKQLPAHLDAPAAVVLDTTHSAPALLLFFDVGDRAKKLVIQINYKVKKAGTLNIADTGKIVDMVGVRNRLGKGYELLEGGL